MDQSATPLSAAQRAKVRRMSEPQELAPDEEGGELNIVPFLDIIINILIFMLATIAVTFTATIDTTPPASQSAGVRSKVQSEALNLTVLIVNDGFSLKASGGNVAPGCDGVGAGHRDSEEERPVRLRRAQQVRREAQGLFSGLRRRDPGLRERQPRHRLPDHHQRHRRGPVDPEGRRVVR